MESGELKNLRYSLLGGCFAFLWYSAKWTEHWMLFVESEYFSGVKKFGQTGLENGEDSLVLICPSQHWNLPT
jgi:hypothetical protein